MKRAVLVFAIITLSWQLSPAQQASEAGSAWLFMPSVAYQIPGGDMAERFMPNFSAGFGVGYKTDHNWIFAVDGQFIFNDKVKDPALLIAPAVSDQGEIFNQVGNYAQISLQQRGVYGTFDVGKNLNFWSANPNSGPNFTIGAGYLTHWVEIKNPGNDAPQVLEEYAKGYDQFSAGPVFKQSIGYMYLSSNRRLNFRVTFEMMQAFTTNLRGFSYFTGRATTGTQVDLLFGFRLQWILPVYSKASDDYFYD